MCVLRFLFCKGCMNCWDVRAGVRRDEACEIRGRSGSPEGRGGCRSPCHVVYTDFRPTPLQHYIFPAGAQSLYMVVDEKARFREDNFQAAIAALTDGADAEAKAGKGDYCGNERGLSCSRHSKAGFCCDERDMAFPGCSRQQGSLLLVPVL